MIRVCRPGGVVAARDGDYSGFVWYPASAGLDRWRKLYRSAARANGGEPDERHEWGSIWAGRITQSATAQQLLTSGLANGKETGMKMISRPSDGSAKRRTITTAGSRSRRPVTAMTFT